MTTKVCNICNTEKDATEFYKSKSNIDKLFHFCKACHVKDARARRSVQRSEDPMLLWAKDTISVSKQRAKRKNREHTLTLEWLLENANSICPLLNIPLIYGAQRRDDHVASLDRRDPLKGYTPDNCKIISTRANRLKNDGTQEELELIAMNLRNY